jgi:hypothetical protein
LDSVSSRPMPSSLRNQLDPKIGCAAPSGVPSSSPRGRPARAAALASRPLCRGVGELAATNPPE